MREIWVVIADSAKATIFQYQGPNSNLRQLHEMTHTHEPTRDLVTGKNGRMPDTGAGHRSALEPSTDPHEHEKHVFAREIAAYLQSRTGNVDRLIIAAAPKMLGELRQLLPSQVKAKVDGELSSDLTKIPVRELPRHLRSVLNIG